MAQTTTIDQAQSLVDLGLRACSAYHRPDLAGRLRRARLRLGDPAVHVVVVGEFKQGKSSLVNALIGASVCPVDDDIATALPTYLRYGDRPEAALLLRDSHDGEDELPTLRREPLPTDAIRRTILERPAPLEPATTTRPAGVEVRLPNPLLRGGLVLVDTPGVGGLGSAHATATLAAASVAQALVFVTDAAQELTRTELEFLRRAKEACGTVVCVMSKTDLYPAWRRVRDLTQAHLAEAGIDGEVIPVASTQRLLAAKEADPELDQESGFPSLVAALRDRVGNHAEHTLATEAAAEVEAVCTQLEAQFHAERAVLADPEEAQRVVAELSAVQRQVQHLKSSAATWSRTLQDGVADLSSDIDHDLRRRIRDVIAEATTSVEASDPADNWPAMQTWLKSRMAGEMLANFTELQERAAVLSELVGDHFREASGEVLSRIDLPDPRQTLGGLEVDQKVDTDRMKVGKQALTVLKSGYGGTVMFIFLGVSIGVTLGPIAVGIALVMGHRGLKEEKKRQREARQRQAVVAIRHYCDQIGFVMSKDSRDTLRSIQRQLRDHYTTLAEELENSNAEALRRATEAARRGEAERKKRLADVDAELERLGSLRQRAAAAASGAPA